MLRPLARAATVVFFCLLEAHASVAAAEERPWVRNDDPVVLQGATLPALLGVAPANLALFRCGDGGFVPIPFQIDQKLPSGDYAFDRGAQTAVDPDPNFDANDELVFLAADAGAPCTHARPPGSLRTARIGVHDRAGAARSAYLFSFGGPAPRSPVDYIQGIQDAKRKVWRVEAKTYRIELADNAAHYDYLSVKNHDGVWSENVVDRLKIRGEATMLWGLIHVPIVADELYKMRFDAWIDGPVRIVALAHGYLDAFRHVLRIPLQGNSLVQLYPTFFVFPLTGYLPIDIGSVLTSLHMHGVNEFNKSVYGHKLRYYDAHVPYTADIAIDGTISAAEKAMDTASDREWMVLAGEKEANLCRFVIPKEWRFATRRLYYKEDESLRDPPEAEPGIVGVGFDVDGLIHLKHGWVTLYLQYYFPETFAVGDEKRILDIMDDPLQVTAGGD